MFACILCVYWLNPSKYLQTTIMTSLLACSKSIILSSLTHPDYYQLGSPSGNLIARCCWVFLPGKPNSFPPTWTKLSFALNAVSITCSIEINIIFLIVCLCLYVCISITIYSSSYIHHHPSIHSQSFKTHWMRIHHWQFHSHCKTHTFPLQNTHIPLKMPLKNFSHWKHIAKHTHSIQNAIAKHILQQSQIEWIHHQPILPIIHHQPILPIIHHHPKPNQFFQSSTTTTTNHSCSCFRIWFNSIVSSFF